MKFATLILTIFLCSLVNCKCVLFVNQCLLEIIIFFTYKMQSLNAMFE